MNKRQIMQALLSGEKTGFIPQWIMAFHNIQLVKKLIPEDLLYDGLSEYPDYGMYPFTQMGAERLTKQSRFNSYIDRCVFPVGWGANAAFGHGGPGEFNKRMLSKEDDSYIVEYETGAKKEIRLNPHYVRIYDLPVKSKYDLENLELPDPFDQDRYSGLAKDIRLAKENGEWTIGWVNGFFSAVHYFLRDYEDFLADLLLEPGFAKALISKLGEWTLASAQRICEADVDCIGFCDDLGSSSSLLISPEMYREFIFPWHRKLCELAHSYNVVVHMHSHGNIMPILKDLVEAGVDILNPLDPDDGMPLEKVREIAGRKLVLCGGMDKHFFDWEKDKQVEFLKELIRMGRGIGPYILMDSGGIPDNVSGEWFNWFIETSRKIRSNGDC